MTADLATVPQLHDFLELSGPDCEAAQAVASGLRDIKAENTRRSYASAWRRFQTWATWQRYASPWPPLNSHAPSSPTYAPPRSRNVGI